MDTKKILKKRDKKEKKKHVKERPNSDEELPPAKEQKKDQASDSESEESDHRDNVKMPSIVAEPSSTKSEKESESKLQVL